MSGIEYVSSSLYSISSGYLKITLSPVKGDSYSKRYLALNLDLSKGVSSQSVKVASNLVSREFPAVGFKMNVPAIGATFM